MSGYYVTAIDRIGWALATGGAAGGVFAGIVAAASGSGPGGVATAALAGASVTAALLVLIAAPIWTWFHHRGLRGPGIAAALGGGIAALLSGFTGAVPAVLAATLCGAAIGWMMQRVGYRRLF